MKRCLGLLRYTCSVSGDTRARLGVTSVFAQDPSGFSMILRKTTEIPHGEGDGACDVSGDAHEGESAVMVRHGLNGPVLAQVVARPLSDVFFTGYAAVIAGGADHPAADEFLEYVRSPICHGARHISVRAFALFREKCS